MGPVVKLLQAIRGLTKSGAIKSLDDAYRLAQRELGETFSRYQNQIKDAFNQGQKEITKITNKPTADIIPFRKKEGIESLSKGKVKDKGEVIEAVFKPGVDKRGKRVEESPSQASGIMQRLEKQKDDLFNMLKNNPYRSGGPLDPQTGLVRTAARQVLQKLAREGKINIADEREAKAIIEGYQGGVDPIEVFRKTFGQDVLIDLSNLGDELIEIERRGGSYKELTKILDDEGFFDLKQPKNPPQGMTDDELEKMLRDDKEEKILKDFDPEDRDPNAMGGIMRANYKIGSGVRLAKFLASKGKNLKEEIKKAVDNIFTTDDPKYDADVALDSMFEELDVDRDMFDQKDIIDAYGMAYDEIAVPFAQKILNKRSFKGVEIKDPKFDENMPFDNDAEKLAEIKMSNEAIDAERAKELTPKMVERLELKLKYPGADDEMLDQILEMDPDRKAQMFADMDMGIKLLNEGKGVDEVKDIIEKGLKTRKDNAEGGLNYLMGM